MDNINSLVLTNSLSLSLSLSLTLSLSLCPTSHSKNHERSVLVLRSWGIIWRAQVRCRSIALLKAMSHKLCHTKCRTKCPPECHTDCHTTCFEFWVTCYLTLKWMDVAGATLRLSEFGCGLLIGRLSGLVFWFLSASVGQLVGHTNV